MSHAESFWILLLILSSAGYSLSRFIRNFLVDTVFTKKNLSAFSLMTTGVYIILILTILAVFGLDALSLNVWGIAGMVVAGALNVLSQFPSFKAMRIAETVEVTIFSQVTPVLALLFGFLFLQQQISGNQLIGFALIMLAGLLLVFTQRNKKAQKTKLETIRLIVTHCALFVLSDIVMLASMGDVKQLSNQQFAKYFLYFEIGSLLTTIAFAIANPTWRRTVKKLFFGRGKSRINLIYSIVNNFLYAFAEAFYKLALITAPAVALHSVVSQVSQLIVTFVLGIFLAYIFPTLGREKITKHILVRHLVAAVLVGMGIILVN